MFNSCVDESQRRGSGVICSVFEERIVCRSLLAVQLTHKSEASVYPAFSRALVFGETVSFKQKMKEEQMDGKARLPTVVWESGAAWNKESPKIPRQTIPHHTSSTLIAKVKSLDTARLQVIAQSLHTFTCATKPS